MDNDLFSNKNMRYIVSIYKNRSITKAAKELYMTQPALSRFLISFEEKLGMPLFDRIGYTFVPTYAGERFVHYALETQKLEQQLSFELDDLEKEMGGRIRLAVPLMRSPFLLPDIIPDFYDMYPNVKIHISESQSDKLENLILDNQVDFAIVNREIMRPGLETIRMYNDQVFLAAPKDNKVARSLIEKYNGNVPPVDISVFAGERFTLLNKGQQLREVADHIFAERKVVPNIALVSRNNQTALNLCASGFSCCIFASTYFRQDLKDSLYVFKLDSEYNNIPINLVYWRDIYMPQYFKDFIKIVERLKK